MATWKSGRQCGKLSLREGGGGRGEGGRGRGRGEGGEGRGGEEEVKHSTWKTGEDKIMHTLEA